MLKLFKQRFNTNIGSVSINIMQLMNKIGT